MMRLIPRRYWCILASIIVILLHFFWLRSTVKWTSPWIFASGYTLLFIFALLMFNTKKLSVGLVGYVLVGMIFGLFASFIAWLISDALYAPYRFGYFGSTSLSLIDFAKLGLYMSTITGCWIVGGVQGFLLHAYITWRHGKKRKE